MADKLQFIFLGEFVTLADFTVFEKEYKSFDKIWFLVAHSPTHYMIKRPFKIMCLTCWLLF